MTYLFVPFHNHNRSTQQVEPYIHYPMTNFEKGFLAVGIIVILILTVKLVIDCIKD